MSLVRPLRVLLLGAPGSGKGTQTSRLLKQFPTLNSLSSGDVLRTQISLATDLGKKASSYIEKGQLVPDSVMVSLITHQLNASSWLHKDASWLLDGFPRTINQADALDKVLSKSNSSLNLVIELDVDQKVILQRIEARWVHIPSGRVYNLDYNPPKIPFKDDITGEPLSKRVDDTAEVFQKRLDLYNTEIKPLRKFYSDKGILEVVSGATSDIIFPKIRKMVIDKFCK